MANKYRGEARLVVGEQEFTLVFDCNAICSLEQQLGMSFPEFAGKTASGTAGFVGVRAMLWAGMLAKHESTTLKRCGELINDVGLKAVSETCWGALRQCFPEASEGNAEAAGDGTGTPS